MKPRHAWVATLLVGLAIGFLAGRGTTPAPGPSRATPVRETGAVRSTASPTPHAPAPKRTLPPAEPTGDADDLPGRAPPEDGYGVLVVDFTGLGLDEPCFTIPVTLLGGGVVPYEGNWSEDTPGLTWLDLRPGTYHPSWTLPGRSGRFGRPVIIEAGRVTRLNAGDPVDALPVPPFEGMGRLQVRVLSSAETPLPSLRVSLEAELNALRDAIEGWTDSEGGWMADALPGPAALRVGDQLVPVTIRLGTTTPIEVRPIDVGELRFELPEDAFGGFSLRRMGEHPSLVEGWLHDCDWARFCAYLAPGEYEICWPDTAFPIGVALVRAGRETRFQGPPGGIRVLCPCGREHRAGWRMSLERPVDGSWHRLMALNGFEVPGSTAFAVVAWLEAGLYRIQVRGLHDHEQVVEVEVAYTARDCVLPLPE